MDERFVVCKRKENNLIKNIVIMVLFSSILAILLLYLNASIETERTVLFSSYLNNPYIIVLNFLPVLLITAVFYAISSRAYIAIALSGIICTTLASVNYFKMITRGDPFMAIDFAYFSEAANMSSKFIEGINKTIFIIALFIIASAVYAFFCVKNIKHKAFNRLRWSLVVVFLAIIAYKIVYCSPNVYKKTENIDANSAFFSEWSEADQYNSRGFMYSFVRSIKDTLVSPPEGYSDEYAQEILSQYEYNDIPVKVNMISIMLEAYADFSEFNSIDFTGNPYKNFHQLQSEGVSGYLVPNIFIGGTIDSERTYLTGASEMKSYRHNISSYVRYFKNQGYTVEGGHPCYKWFYNRQNVNKYFGFSNYHFFEDRYLTETGEMLLDQFFFDDIITLYNENKKTGNPYFNFSVTYQNHGPYDTKVPYFQTPYVNQGDLSNEAYTSINNYLYGISRTDAALAEFIDYFRSESEPVIIVLFGDHKPWMGDGSAYYSELGIDINWDTDEGFYNNYKTPYVIWANPAAKEALGKDFTGHGRTISPMYLMNEVFEYAGFAGDNYMKLTNEMRNYADIIHISGRFRENGVMTTELSSEAQEFYNKLKIVEYYRSKYTND